MLTLCTILQINKETLRLASTIWFIFTFLSRTNAKLQNTAYIIGLLQFEKQNLVEFSLNLD